METKLLQTINKYFDLIVKQSVQVTPLKFENEKDEGERERERINYLINNHKVKVVKEQLNQTRTWLMYGGRNIA